MGNHRLSGINKRILTPLVQKNQNVRRIVYVLVVYLVYAYWRHFLCYHFLPLYVFFPDMDFHFGVGWKGGLYSLH